MTRKEPGAQGACERCGKEPATVRIRRLAEGKEEEYHLCRACAREMGVDAPAAPKGALTVDPVTLLFQGIEETRDTGSVCPRCGLTSARFRETGRLGCAACYQTFREELMLLMRRVQGAVRHRGRRPVEDAELEDTEARIRQLHEALERAVLTEDYERAAELRDRLRDLGVAIPRGGDAQE